MLSTLNKAIKELLDNQEGSDLQREWYEKYSRRLLENPEDEDAALICALFQVLYAFSQYIRLPLRVNDDTVPEMPELPEMGKVEEVSARSEAEADDDLSQLWTDV